MSCSIQDRSGLSCFYSCRLARGWYKCPGATVSGSVGHQTSWGKCSALSRSLCVSNLHPSSLCKPLHVIMSSSLSVEVLIFSIQFSFFSGMWYILLEYQLKGLYGKWSTWIQIVNIRDHFLWKPFNCHYSLPNGLVFASVNSTQRASQRPAMLIWDFNSFIPR